jgi:predicted HNH restriction endonuclease
MGRKSPNTTNTQIRSALRQLWLRSRERAAALKGGGYCCSLCGIKQSRAKDREVYIEVHHKDGIDWEGLFDEIRKKLLHDPDRLISLCKKCHDKQEGKGHERRR